MKRIMIRIGTFLFKWRNAVFPLILVALFVLVAPRTALFGRVWLEEVHEVFAALVSTAGLAVRGVTIGYAYIKRGGLNKKVYADTLVTGGLFSLCRNPLYLGNMLIASGVAIMHGDPVVVFGGIFLFWFFYQCIIYAEEAYLADKFAADFSAYCRDVPRWVPRLARFSGATEGMGFNIRRVIVKDYATIIGVVAMFAVTEAYEYLAAEGTHGPHRGLILGLAGVVACCAVGAVFFRYARRRIAI